MVPSEMTSRERVRAAAKGLPVDRVPVMYWINPHMACKMISTEWPGKDRHQASLARLLWRLCPQDPNSQGGDLRRVLPIVLNGYASGDYALELGADIAIPPTTAIVVKKVYFEKGRLRAVDAFGSVRGVGGIYADVIEPAIKSIDDLKTCRFPDPGDERSYLGIRRSRARHPDASIVAETYGVQDLFFTQLWKMDAAMMALYDHPQEVKAFQRRFADWAVETAVRGVRAGADMVLIYDDYGHTGRPLISMEMWVEFTYPHLKRLIDASHEEGALVMLHSCGYQMPFLQHFVRAGLDILQPFQPKAGNDLAEAIGRVGEQLAFCTGIDIQLGELMAPEELRADILRHYQVGRSGRLVLGTTHMLQYTMPLENTRAILQTVREIQLGLHG